MIIGIITEDGKVMGQQEALSTALANGEVDGYPPDVLWSIMKSWKSDKPSASQLGRAARQNILENILDYYIRVHNRMPLFRGSVVHKGLEHASLPGSVPVIREKRLKSTLPLYKDIELSGQIDLYYINSKKLVDYKTCTKMPSSIRDYHILQLAVYKWLLTWSGYDVEEVGITYISWNQIKYLSTIVLARGSIPAIDSWMMQDEEAFQNKIKERYTLLYEGYHAPYVIPPMSKCNRAWCKNCPVKWACDSLPAEGITLTQEEFDELNQAEIFTA